MQTVDFLQNPTPIKILIPIPPNEIDYNYRLEILSNSAKKDSQSTQLSGKKIDTDKMKEEKSDEKEKIKKEDTDKIKKIKEMEDEQPEIKEIKEIEDEQLEIKEELKKNNLKQKR